jgi:hypothetical protein
VLCVVEEDVFTGNRLSKFKATRFAVLERVRKTGEPVVVTRFG